MASRYTIWWAAARAGVREVTILVKHAKAVLNRTFEQALEALPELSVFQSRDHETLLQIADLAKKAAQYDIGNPNTASKMTRDQLAAAQYAPFRVVLYEDSQDQAIFEFDKPSSLFG